MNNNDYIKDLKHAVRNIIIVTILWFLALAIFAIFLVQAIKKEAPSSIVLDTIFMIGVICLLVLDWIKFLKAKKFIKFEQNTLLFFTNKNKVVEIKIEEIKNAEYEYTNKEKKIGFIRINLKNGETVLSHLTNDNIVLMHSIVNDINTKTVKED